APPATEKQAAEKSRKEAIAKSVALAGGELSWSLDLTIIGASGRDGSKTKIRPSIGFGAKAGEPERIAGITDSPSARARARTVPATIAGRAARTPTFQIVRQRFTPSASEPSSQPGFTELRASGKMDTTSGAIMIVSTTTAAISE